MFGNISTSYVTIRFPRKALSNELSYIHQYSLKLLSQSKFQLQSDPQQQVIQRQEIKGARMLHTNFNTNIHAHEQNICPTYLPASRWK